jgi:hypothetical protein
MKTVCVMCGALDLPPAAMALLIALAVLVLAAVVWVLLRDLRQERKRKAALTDEERETELDARQW